MKSREKELVMITTKAELKRILEMEGKLYHKKWYYHLPIKMTEQQVLYLHAYYLRKAEYTCNVGSIWRKYYLFRLLRLQTCYGISIPLNVLGEGFEMAHLGSVIVNADAKIGAHAKIHPGVCVGGNKGKAPQIGENVYLGPGCKVFGDVTLADDIQVGANAVVTKSCLIKGTTLVGIPAKPVE